MKSEIEQIGKNVYTHFALLQDALEKAVNAGFEVRATGATSETCPTLDKILPKNITVSMTSMEVVERPRDALKRLLEKAAQR